MAVSRSRITGTHVFAQVRTCAQYRVTKGKGDHRDYVFVRGKVTWAPTMGASGTT